MPKWGNLWTQSLTSPWTQGKSLSLHPPLDTETEWNPHVVFRYEKTSTQKAAEGGAHAEGTMGGNMCVLSFNVGQIYLDSLPGASELEYRYRHMTYSQRSAENWESYFLTEIPYSHHVYYDKRFLSELAVSSEKQN